MENDVLDALEDLGYDGPLMEEGALLSAVEHKLLTPAFMTLCVWLSDNLKTVCRLGETLSEKEDQETFRMEMSGLLKELECPHSQLSGVNGLSTIQNRLLLLDYLSSELQACRILGEAEEEKMEIDSQATSPLLYQLKLILTALELPTANKDSAVFNLFSQIEAKMRQLLNKLKKDHLGKPLLTKRLSKTQWAKVDKINEQLNNEYTLRRQMLLKRLDVTIQSFGWSDKAKRKKDQMASAFQPIRKLLPVTAPVNVADILSARSDLLKQPRTSSEEFRVKTACAINKVLMGKVPDRGGRTVGMQAPPPEMPSFKKREENPRDQRPGSGRGQGRVQRGGFGGGGGSRNRGGWDRGANFRGMANPKGGGYGEQQERKVYYS